jgi:hypothetical protein
LLLQNLQDHSPAETAVAVLQLAMNCSNSATAAAAASRIPLLVASTATDLPAILQPVVARRLLLTAATRQHAEAVACMVALPAIAEHLDAATLGVMLRQLLRHDACITKLCQLPVAAELSTNAVTQLLQAAHEEGEYGAARLFCGLDASQQLSSEQVEALLQGILTQPAVYGWSRTTAFCEALHRLPGALQMNSSAVVRLLRTGIRVHAEEDADNVVSKWLCELPAAADISSADVASLLREAFAKPSNDVIDLITQDIMQLPSYDHLNSADVAELLHAAAEYYVDGSWWQTFKGLTSLCELEAAQDLSSEQVLQPLQLTLRQNGVGTAALCDLPAVQQLSSEAVAQLLQAAIASGCEGSVEALLDLPAVQQLSSYAVAQLLQAAIAAGSEQSFELLFQLQAARQLSSGPAVQLLQAALAGDLEQSFRLLCTLPPVQQLSSYEVELLLQAAVKRGSAAYAKHLCRLPAAVHLSWE